MNGRSEAASSALLGGLLEIEDAKVKIFAQQRMTAIKNSLWTQDGYGDGLEIQPTKMARKSPSQPHWIQANLGDIRGESSLRFKF